MAKGEKTMFYLAQGSNGVIIHKDEERAEACQKYIKESEIYKFTDFGKAEQQAIFHLRNITRGFVPVPNYIRLDEMITAKKLREKATQSRRSHYRDLEVFRA